MAQDVEIPEGFEVVSLGGGDLPEGFSIQEQKPITQAQAYESFLPPQSRAVLGALESGVSVGSSMIAEPLAGLWGIISSPFTDTPAGTMVEQAREALTYAPQLKTTEAILGGIGEAVDTGMTAARSPVAGLTGLGSALVNLDLDKGAEAARRVMDEGIGKVYGDYTFEATGSPALATMVESAPTAMAEIFTLKGISRLRGGTKLLDKAGNPSRELQVYLNKNGLDYENLKPEVKALIPAEVPKGLDKAKKVKSAADEALKGQILSGGTDDALAGLKVVGGEVVPDKLGLAAIKQGFEPNFVQRVKVSNPQTKKAMREALKIMRRFKRDSGIIDRPTDVAGNALNSRVQFIRKKTGEARVRLNDIANSELSKIDVDVTPVGKVFQSALDDLDIKPIHFQGDRPVIDFTGSLISKNAASKRVIKDTVDLFAEVGQGNATVNAQRLHKLKRQLDDLIDFKKKSSAGLPESGRRVLKDVRSSINDLLREASPNYAKNNDIISSSLRVMDEFESLMGKQIDIFGDRPAAAIGQDLRGLLSNRKSRVRLENAVESISKQAESLGGDFKINPRDLILFADGLEDRFGAVARTSFKGEIESALKSREIANQGVKQTVINKAADKAGEQLDKLRGVNDFEAFMSIEDLLKGIE